MILAWILLFTFISGTLSLIGGVILLGNARWVHKFSIHFISFAAGTLLATSLLDLIPEAIETGADVSTIMRNVLIGIGIFFIIELIIHKFHSHCYDEKHDHHNHVTPTLLSVGDALHNTVDGVIVAGAFLVSIHLGIITAVAVAAHELPQEISDFSIMLQSGWSKIKVLWMNILVSLTSILGALITYYAKNIIEPYLPFILAIIAGSFVYIACTDLFPQISGEKHDKPLHVVTLLIVGITSVVYLGTILDRYVQ